MSELALKLIAENKKTKAPFLDLGNCGLVNYLPEELGDCVWLERLNLGGDYYDENKEWIETNNKGRFNIFTGNENELYFLERITGLQSLDISSNYISNISFLQKLTSLQSLNLSENEISDISFLEKLTSLKSLYINFNRVSDISFLEKLTDLQSLDLSCNQISNFSILEKLTNLQSLCVTQNEISDYSFLKKLTKLHSLEISNNKLSDISFLETLSYLQSLDLSYNHILDFSLLEKLTNLKSITLRNNKILDTKFLEKLTSLESLCLDNNQISDFCFLEKFTKLKSLHLSNNQISDISFLEKITNLKSLYLSNNQISDISYLEKLTNLKSLYLSNNQISDISFLEKITNLKSLYLSNNQISDISFLEKLTDLQSLELSGNQISDINFLKKLTNLEFLELRENQIFDIQLLENFTNLKFINLSNNQISDLDEVKRICSFEAIDDIILNGNPLPLPENLNLDQIEELRTYFKDSEVGISTKRNIKLLFMGDGCAGKSTLYQHLITGTEPPIINVNDRTHGIAIDIWQGVMPKVDIRVWDFGGQDIFHSTHRLFLGQRAVYVLVWTKQANKKCTEGEQHPLRYWLDFIADYGKNSTVILVENIIDGQFDSSEFPDDDSLEQLVAEYQQKGIRLDTTHHRINCKHDSRGVKRFKGILQSEIEQLLDDFPIEGFPDNWYRVQEALEQLRTEQKTIQWIDYEAICKRENISNTHALLSYLDRSGVVSYYPDLFKNQIILQTDWILDAMYSFLKLKDNQFLRLEGKLIDDDFNKVWQERYSSEEQALFKSYMLKSEVMAEPRNNYWVEIERDYKYLIPALFKTCKPHEKVKWENEDYYLALQLRFVYSAIIQRLQVKILTYCHVEEAESFYKNRISFTDKGGKVAHIELLEEEKELRIWAEHEDLYNDILKELNDIYPLDHLKIIERRKGKDDKEITYEKNRKQKEHGFDRTEMNKSENTKPMNNDPIKVFVTYCWTNREGKTDEEHQKKVRSFTDELISYEDFNATFDLYENEKSTATNFIRMMYENIKSRKKVIIVLSEGYAKKADEFLGGVGIEYQAIMNDIQANPRKYILVSFDKRNGEIYPFGLQGTDTLVIKNGNLELSENEEDKNRLFAKLMDEPIYEIPARGNKVAIVKKK
jgi:internalin A